MFGAFSRTQVNDIRSAYKRRMQIAVLLLLCVSAVLSGCSGREVLSKLDASSSIEVVVALHQAGIEARRVKSTTGRSESYSVFVEEADYGRALQALSQYGLPGANSESIEDVTRVKGFVPNSIELSEFRLDRALALEIERLLRGLPGVVTVKAIVRSNLRFPLDRREAQRSTLSLAVRYTAAGGEIPFSVDSVNEIAAGAVPGLRAEDVKIVLTPIVIQARDAGETANAGASLVQLEPFRFQVLQHERNAALLQIFAAILILGGFSVIVGISFGGVLKRHKSFSSRGSPQRKVSDNLFGEAGLRVDDLSRRRTETFQSLASQNQPPRK